MKTSFFFRLNFVLLILICCLAPLRTYAQFAQQGGKLVGTGSIGSAKQGYSTSLSSDGNTAIVGGINDNGGAGAAWVYSRSGSAWTQQGNKLVGTGAVGNANQGYSVSLSGDGNTAIVSGYYDNNQVGAAWIYTGSGGVWTQQGGKLVGTGAVGGSVQGWSVALSSDGNTAIVGAPHDNNYAGAAWIYTRSGGVWTQQGNKLVGTGTVGVAHQGISVSLSSDGNTALIGGWYDNNQAGAFWVWTRSGGVWTQQGGKMVSTGAVGNAHQGHSVSLSADGNTALIGAYSDNTNAGAVWVWTRSGTTWSQQGSKLVGTGATGNAQQGFIVSLSSDGNTALAGGYSDNTNAGAAWVWTRAGTTWTQQGSKLVGTGATGNAQQGYSVSLSGDGSTALVGGASDNTNAGAAWIFTQPSVGVFPQTFALRHLNLENGKLLRFDLPQKERVRIRLFNSQGRMMSQLLDETRDAGNYSIPLSGEMKGSYFLDFRAGNFQKTIQM